MKKTTTESGVIDKLREYKVINDDQVIKTDFIKSCFRPERKRKATDMQLLVALIIVLMVVTISFILYDRQMKVVEGLHNTVDQMVGIQRETIDWVSDVQEQVIDNHIRVVELEGKK